MVHNKQEFLEKLPDILSHREDEIIEFKEAKNEFPFNEIGEYFSALSCEANLRRQDEAWLLFGVKNNGEVCGTHFREQKSEKPQKNDPLQGLKKDIASHTNQRITFRDIYEVIYEGARIVAFQIPPALQGIPTTWNGMAFAREGDSLVPLPLNKLDEIRESIGSDWSKVIVYEASLDDLDPEAIKKGREMFALRMRKGDNDLNISDYSDDIEFLDKIGLTLDGRITRAALLIMGKRESVKFFDGFIPRITWTLYNADNSVKAYHHFELPFITAVDAAYSAIRNVRYQYIAAQNTLFPDVVDEYDSDLVKELINNSIAHSDFSLRGRIDIEEFEDHLVFRNNGSFIPGTIEKALELGYKPRYYHNPFLCSAMMNLYMMDQNSIGIPKIFQIQKERSFPLPTYDLKDPEVVSVTIYGRILDKNYTQLLHANQDLDMRTVFLLDKVQKGEPIEQEDCKQLRRLGLVEGRYPHLYVSAGIAAVTGTKDEYIRNKGFDDQAYKKWILNYLKEYGEGTKQDFMKLLYMKLPDTLDDRHKEYKVKNLLTSLRSSGQIIFDGGVWLIPKK